MRGVNQLYFGLGVITRKRFGAGRNKPRIEASPDCEGLWLLLAEVALKVRIEFDVVPVVKKQVKLDLDVTGTRDERRIEGVVLRLHSFNMRDRRIDVLLGNPASVRAPRRTSRF